MNARINEIERWCFKEVPCGVNGRTIAMEFDRQKFAELIVRMCADAADMAQDAGCEYAGDYVAEYMGFGEIEGVTEWRAK